MLLLPHCSTTLQRFHAQANSGNISRLARIEEALSENRLQQAAQFLNHFTPGNNVEANAQAFFTAYLHLKQNRFSATDSLELHRLVRGCVPRDGFAVAEARALYRLKFRDFTNFFDDCGATISQRLMDTEIINSEYNFEVYPNPNDGNMTVSYVLPKAQKGKVIITDLTGRQIAVYQVSDEQNTMLISETKLENGIFFCSLYVEGEFIGTKKLVIIK